MTVVRSTLTGNDAFQGGAVTPGGGATVEIFSSVLSDNSTTSPGTNQGGAISIAGSSVLVVDSTITGNSAVNSGGAIYNLDTLTILASTLSDNSSKSSGGVLSNIGTATIVASTFTGNSATSGGVILTKARLASQGARSLGIPLAIGAGCSSTTREMPRSSQAPLPETTTANDGGGIYKVSGTTKSRRIDRRRDSAQTDRTV